MDFGKKFEAILLVFMFLVCAVLTAEKINLVTADLGRHIKNGEIIVNALAAKGGILRVDKVLRENFYSYTYPAYPFLSHHWGSGVLFYLTQRVFGFTGISVFFLSVCLITFAVFFDLAVKKGGFAAAFLCSIVLLPLIVNRTEIRPEAFSSLFCGIFLWVLWSKKWLFALPVLLFIWVNVHVYFFLGFFLIGIFLIEEAIDILFRKGKNWRGLGNLVIILVICFLVSLFNPAGLKGVVYPLQIFGNYGYRVLENQTVWFLDKIISYPANLYFKIGFGLLLASWVYVIASRKPFNLLNFLLSIFISYLGWTAVRNFTLFGLFALPVLSENFSFAREGLAVKGGLAGESQEKIMLKNFLVSSLAVLIIFCVIFY